MTERHHTLGRLIMAEKSIKFTICSLLIKVIRVMPKPVCINWVYNNWITTTINIFFPKDITLINDSSKKHQLKKYCMLVQKQNLMQKKILKSNV